MLEILRQGATGWVAKILMGLLVLSFVGWGVITRQATGVSGGSTLLTVGGQNVTTQQYQRLFSEELRRVEMQAHQQIPVATAHQIGVDQQVISGLLIDAHARDLNLGISDQALADKLKNEKSLQAPDGSIDRTAYAYLLQQLGLSDAGYRDMLRRNTVREQLLGSVGAAAPAPQALVEAFNQMQGEQRTLDYFLVPPAKAPAAVAPDDAKLKEFFEARKEQYKAPEYRTAGVLLASPDDIKGTMTVGDDEVKAAYDATKESYGKPELRHVQLMTFQDKAAAEKALAAIKTGKDFLAVAKDMGLAEADVDRGLIKKSQLLDPIAADAAFKLENDKVSDLIDGALATSIVRVTEIQPSTQKSFDDVKGEIRDKLARERAVKALLDFRGKIEDARASGTQLKEMPGKFPFKYTEVPAMDKDGKGSDGKPASTLPNLAAILKAMFASDVGVEADPIDLGQSGWAWVEVKDVKAARQKTLDEVKADVTAAFQDNAAATALGKLALDLTDRANKGEDFAKLAAEGGSTVKTVAAVTRRTKSPELPPAAPQLAFSLAKGTAASLTAADGKSKLVFKVADIKPAKPLDDAARKDLTAQLGQEMSGALTAQYLASLEKTYGFSMDKAAFDRMLGNAPPADQPDQTDQ